MILIVAVDAQSAQMRWLDLMVLMMSLLDTRLLNIAACTRWADVGHFDVASESGKSTTWEAGRDKREIGEAGGVMG